MRVLENNNKPATHFIEVIKEAATGVYVTQKLFKIDVLNTALSLTRGIGTTIAIFKIRAK